MKAFHEAEDIPVSYTHLDVYKRQVFWRGFFVWAGLETTAKSTSPFSRAVRASGVE